jgi:hypothetical protein
MPVSETAEELLESLHDDPLAWIPAYVENRLTSDSKKYP